MQTADPTGLERGVARICHVVLWISTVVIFLILVANTVLRYATSASLQWANEVPELLFPWLVMSGVVLAAIHGAHIATTFLMDSLAPPVRRIVAAGTWAVVAALYGTLTVATARMLEVVHDERTPILQLPGSVTYFCVMTGMAFLALLAAQSAWKVWQAAPVRNAESHAPTAHW